MTVGACANIGCWAERYGMCSWWNAAEKPASCGPCLHVPASTAVCSDIKRRYVGLSDEEHSNNTIWTRRVYRPNEELTTSSSNSPLVAYH